MPDEQQIAVVPTQSRPVDFYGEELVIALVDDEPYVAVRPVCDYLGLAWNGQFQRLQRDEVLSRHTQLIAMPSADGKRREMISLQLEYLPGWLFGVNPSRVAKADPAVQAQLQAKLTRYREECFQVLWRAFQAELVERSPMPAPASSTAALAQVREIALAVAQMAEQQMALQEHVGGLGQRLDRAAEVVGDLQRRVSVVEQRTAPASRITDAQATAVAAAVKALAELLTTRDRARNHYQGIFAELYRRFGVSSYKTIRIEQYEAALQFLDDWRTAALQGRGGPTQPNLF